MPKLNIPDSLYCFRSGGRAAELLDCNKKLSERGFALTCADAEDILSSRYRCLKSLGRIELDISVTIKIIDIVSRSPYTTNDNFVDTVNELYEVFHYIKNATSDFTGDNELLETVTECFKAGCGGSTELLRGRGAEAIIDSIVRENEYRKGGE